MVKVTIKVLTTAEVKAIGTYVRRDSTTMESSFQKCMHFARSMDLSRKWTTTYFLVHSHCTTFNAFELFNHI